MLHCLRADSYRKPKAEPAPGVEEFGLHPLVVEAGGKIALKPSSPSVDSFADMLLDDVELSYGTKVSLHIGSCSKAALVSLIKEMEATLC